MTVSRLYMPAVTLAGAVALAGCGGGSTPPAAAGDYDSASIGGSWTAQAYGGSATARPDGIYGAFSADFSDGNAAGVYHAGKE